MKKLGLFFFTTVLGSFSIRGGANAALIDRGEGLIYDSDQNSTWLQNANYAGSMNWSDMTTWASSLEYYDSVRDITWDNWRLPSTPGTAGGNVNEGEISYLFYAYGISSSSPGDFIGLGAGVSWYTNIGKSPERLGLFPIYNEGFPLRKMREFPYIHGGCGYVILLCKFSVHEVPHARATQTRPI